MSDSADFIGLALRGKVMLDEIDDYVDQWHARAAGEPLHKYLGMKKSEYERWVTDPDSLPYIIKARRENKPLDTVLTENYLPHPIAARSDKTKLDKLINWLKKRGKLD
jgi:hypothetical protein